MSKPRTPLATATALLLALAGCAATGSVDPKANVGPDKVVYHVNDSGAQAVNALRNIGNHLEVNPKAHIVVVTHAQGVDFLFDGATDRNGNPYERIGFDQSSRKAARSRAVAAVSGSRGIRASG